MSAELITLERLVERTAEALEPDRKTYTIKERLVERATKRLPGTLRLHAASTTKNRPAERAADAGDHRTYIVKAGASLGTFSKLGEMRQAHTLALLEALYRGELVARSMHSRAPFKPWPPLA